MKCSQEKCEAEAKWAAMWPGREEPLLLCAGHLKTAEDVHFATTGSLLWSASLEPLVVHLVDAEPVFVPGQVLQVVGEEKESPATLSDPPKTTD